MPAAKSPKTTPAPALLALEDGTLFRGASLGLVGQAAGEVVFNTSHCGYQEILSDPSYHSQLIAFTFPHIGNTGTNAQDMESRSVRCAGLIVRESCALGSSWRNDVEFQRFLERAGLIGIRGIDTRRLTAHIRDRGAQNGCILSGDEPDAESAVAIARNTPSMEGLALAPSVSTQEAYDWDEGSWQSSDAAAAKTRIAVWDFGCKLNILRLLRDLGCAVRVFPYESGPEDLIAFRPDGIFLSNGPGDPAACEHAISATRQLLNTGIPVLGICLGHQILALALGAKTEKMKFGHHGANHPVRELATGRVFVSSQNHGFAVSDKGLPDGIRITHRSLFDDSIQGFVHGNARGFQGHPEASPGPEELGLLLREFVASASGSEDGDRAR